MIKIHNFSVSLPYKEDIRPYDAKLNQNMTNIKKKYRMAQRGITMPMLHRHNNQSNKKKLI